VRVWVRREEEEVLLLSSLLLSLADKDDEMVRWLVEMLEDLVVAVVCWRRRDVSRTAGGW